MGNNPLNDFDPLGLNSAMGCANPANAAACAAAGIAVRVTPVQCPPDKDPDDECKKLEEKVRKAKDKMGTYAKGTAVCKEGMSWWQLRTRKNDWLDLAQARAQRDQKCYNGGDPDHQDAQITAWRQVVICGSLM